MQPNGPQWASLRLEGVVLLAVVDQVAGKLDDLLEGGRTRKDHDADMRSDERDGTKAGDEADDLASRGQGGEGFFFVHGRRLVRVFSSRVAFAFQAHGFLLHAHNLVALLVDLLARSDGGHINFHAGGTQHVVRDPGDPVILRRGAAAGTVIGAGQLAGAVLLGLGGNGLGGKGLGPGDAGRHIFHGSKLLVFRPLRLVDFLGDLAEIGLLCPFHAVHASIKTLGSITGTLLALGFKRHDYWG